MFLFANIQEFTDHKKSLLMTSRPNQSHVGTIKLIFLLLHYIEGPQNILIDNLSRLHCLPMSFQSMEGEKFVEPAVVSGDEDKEDFLLTANTPVFLL